MNAWSFLERVTFKTKRRCLAAPVRCRFVIPTTGAKQPTTAGSAMLASNLLPRENTAAEAAIDDRPEIRPMVCPKAVVRRNHA